MSELIPPFVDRQWLADHPEAQLADVRFRLDGSPGRPAYEHAHVPGAVYVDMTEVLSAPVDAGLSAGRHPLANPERFAAGLAAAGLSDQTPIVAYDDDRGVIAARLVWMLRATGHAAALLDGGMQAFADGELEAGPGPRLPAATFAPVPWPAELLIGIDDVAAGAASGRPVIIDARPAGRFAGTPDEVDPRAGHIPTARSVPARENVDADGRIADPGTLRARFAQVGVGPDTDVISYCGGGVTACHNLLALEYAGLRPGRLYPGSWSEWSRRADAPIET